MINFPHFGRSYRHALDGLLFALRYNQNLRIHFASGVLVVLASVLLHLDSFEMSVLGVMILLVISAEMINTALEEMVNLITSEHRKEAKIAKDVAAGMVLLTTWGSIIIGILIFTPHLLRFL